VLARKSVRQRFASPSLKPLMESFRLMCNDAIRTGRRGCLFAKASLEADLPRADAVWRPELLQALHHIEGRWDPRLTEEIHQARISHKDPYLSKPLLVSCYGFKIQDGSLLVPLGDRKSERIPLNAHTLAVISQACAKVRSFTLTELSLCIAREVEETRQVEGVVGIDRNLRKVTVENTGQVTYYDVSKAVEIAETTRSVVRSFRRDDVRIRKELATKYSRRRQERVRQILSRVSKSIVAEARAKRQAIAFEDITGIRKLYRTGNGQGREFRGRMSTWPFAELKRQMEYKSAWEGIPFITLTKGETRGTTMDCAICGERLRSAVRDDSQHYRQLWCQKCERWEDRDLVAVMNISRRAWLRFGHAKGGGR
jgi:putative transposase